MLGITILLCISASVVWSETMDNLVERNGLYYKKFTDVPFTGKVDGQYNGSIKNGKKQGLWRRYYDNGQLSFKCNYKNGIFDGFCVTYWDNGKLISKGKYKNNDAVDSWVYYWRDGKVRSKGKYKNSLRDGYWVYYNDKGTLIEFLTGTYKNDKRISD